MALALYRKYRPRTFAEVIGQEHVTEPLSTALRTGRLHHAYLFSGPRGCGKTSSARILARSLNCEKGPTPEPCGECDSCLSLAPDGPGSIDVIEIDAASHGGVDDARDLRERAFFAPVASRFKIYVIDEAHMVSTQGFNALLKLVEEPPDYVKFVFATTEPEKVLGTIKSRTHHYPFRLMPPGVLRPYLEELAEREGVRVESPVFPLVVRAGGGSARDSLSVLDQLIAGAGPEGVTYQRAVALLGVTDVALIDEMCDALAAGDGATAYASIDRVADAGHDPRRFAQDLLERLRDLIVLQQVPDAVAKGLLDGPDDQLARMAAQAERFGPATLSRMADIVHNGLIEMRGTTAPRLLLELVTARMLLPGAEDSAAALLQRLERMERRLGAGGFDPEAAPVPVREESPAPPRSTTSVGTGSQPAARPTDSEARADSGPASDRLASTRESTPAPAAVARESSRSAARTVPDEAQGPASVAGETETQPGPTASGHGHDSGDAPGPATPALATSAPAAPALGAVDAAAVRRVWGDVLTMVGHKSKKTAALLRDAIVRDVDGDTLVLTFKHQVHADMLTKEPDGLLDAVYEMFGGRWQLRAEITGDTRSAPPRPVAAPPPPPPAPRAAPKIQEPTPAPAEDDWPTTARPGGGTTETKAPAKPRATKAATKNSGRTAARTLQKDLGPPVDEEPPYDPDYDGPPPKAAGPSYEGFDPGDEPTDDVVDEQTARQSSEQQALALLQAELGAEKIGEVDHR